MAGMFRMNCCRLAVVILPVPGDAKLVQPRHELKEHLFGPVAPLCIHIPISRIGAADPAAALLLCYFAVSGWLWHGVPPITSPSARRTASASTLRLCFWSSLWGGERRSCVCTPQGLTVASGPVVVSRNVGCCRDAMGHPRGAWNS